jgi:biotin carboxyl carrier protein
LLAPEEPQGEVPQDQEQAPEAPIQAPASPQEEPKPEEDPEIIKIEDDEEEEANGGEQPPSPPPDAAAEDVPPPLMGWTMKIYHKAGDAVAHHRLVGMLSAYFADWHPAVEYVC